MFFDLRRYDLVKVGRYKFNKKLLLWKRIFNKRVVQDVVDLKIGEILVKEGEVIIREIVLNIQDVGINEVWVYVDEERIFKVVGNNIVKFDRYVEFDVFDFNIKEFVYKFVLDDIFKIINDVFEIKRFIKEKEREFVFYCFIIDDIYVVISYFLGFKYGIGIIDDIDYLGNRRVRVVGEFL